MTISFVDRVYQGDEARRAAYEASRIFITVVKRADTPLQGLVVLPKRWVVERTLGWINRARGLSKDFEAAIESSLAWLQLALAFLPHAQHRHVSFPHLLNCGSAQSFDATIVAERHALATILSSECERARQACTGEARIVVDRIPSLGCGWRAAQNEGKSRNDGRWRTVGAPRDAVNLMRRKASALDVSIV